jgi:hypothetical protein
MARTCRRQRHQRGQAQLADDLQRDQGLAEVVVRLRDDEVDALLDGPAELLGVHGPDRLPGVRVVRVTGICVSVNIAPDPGGGMKYLDCVGRSGRGGNLTVPPGTRPSTSFVPRPAVHQQAPAALPLELAPRRRASPASRA